MEDVLLSELLDISNFKRLHHSIIVRNLTSNTLVGRNGPIGIVEFFPSGIIIKANPRSCSVGHLASLLFMNDKVFDKLKALPDVGAIKGAFEVLGRVKRMENKLDSQIITIEFTQFDNVKWEKFFHLYRIRQKQINDMTRRSEKTL